MSISSAVKDQHRCPLPAAFFLEHDCSAEHLRRTGPDSIAYDYLVDDPVMYAKPWKQERVLTTLKPTAGLPELLEYSCNENNKDLNHLISTKPGK